jgi:hypothetical protein
MEESPSDITRGGAIYPPILSVDDNFETAPRAIYPACVQAGDERAAAYQ